jgi:hypothetical protein
VSTAVDRVGFFDALADRMNAHPERFSPLGEAEMAVGVVMRRDDGAFGLLVEFEGIECAGVAEADPPTLTRRADFSLVGDLGAWETMFADIRANGRATGLQTINSLALLGDRIRCEGSDPMGIDKFSRFNQTLQEFLDGAATVAAD